ncbi:transglycosylase domain-containing protein [Desulfogranum japonicum]|uniref:transglycosylase domain-containing protein n=1 Tax=Desulfogranum japonicum TaxID=231447 RepID=UPI0004160D47|nr:transglycosylase domain-containing protein [Desulfogranum japonicum]
MYWDTGPELYRKGIECFMDVFSFSFQIDLFLAFLAMAILWHLAGFWLWIYTVQTVPNEGAVKPPLPDQPLRYFFRLRLQRTTGAVVSSLLAFLFALQALQNIAFDSFAPGLFSFVYTFPLLPELGSKSTAWVVYGAVHLSAAFLGWLLLAVQSLRQLGASRHGTNAFLQYQAKHNPVAKAYVIVVLLTHYPLCGITAGALSHPFHGMVVLCSLVGILTAALLGQVISLRIMRGHDIWLASLMEKARIQGRFSTEYGVWESTMVFLTGERPFPLGAETGFTPNATAYTDKSDGRQATEEGEQLLAKAKIYLQKNKTRKARKILQKLRNHQDYRIRQYAEEVLHNLSQGHGNRFPIAGLLRISAVFVLAIGIAGSLVLVFQWGTLPGAEETRQLARSAHFHVKKYNDNDTSRIRLFGNRYDYSLNTSLENISEDFQHAVVASEDHRFYDHGASYILAKFTQAGLYCAASKLSPLSNGACHGNSTLAQQLARNLFLSEERSVTRKLSELVWALKMETGLSKEEILDFYMNRIYLGNGNYGIEMAARDYFNKKAVDLQVSEAAYLAAAIKRPSWNWHQDRDNANKRAKLILALMKKYGYAEPGDTLHEGFKPLKGYKTLHKPYLGHLWQWAKADVAPLMESFPEGNYKVLTTLNAEVQVYAEKVLSKEIAYLKNIGKPVSQGAVVVMRPDGKVLAMVGGVGEKGRHFNRAKRTTGLLPRPPASTFKPFVYLAALEAGFKPSSSIYAGPLSIPMGGRAEPYRPQNYDGRKYNTVSLHDGLVHSINTAAVRLLHDHVGFDALFDTVERLGIQPETLGKQWGLALGQSGVSLIEMTAAYAVFANGGREVTPYTVNSITSESGKTIWHRPEHRARRIFQKEDISNMNLMLRDVVRQGTGKQAVRGLSKNIMIAGKTGTGDAFVDAWFIGYCSDLVVGVWLGNDTPIAMEGVYGGTGPARVFNNLLKNLLNYTHVVSMAGTLP